MPLLKGKVRNPEQREYMKYHLNQDVFFFPAAPDEDWFKTSTALAAQTTTLAAASMTKAYSPNRPVCPVLVITNDVASGETSWTSVAVTFLGVDQFGDLVTHSMAATDSSDTWTASCPVAYATLTSITFVVTGGTACDASDAYILGYAQTYGLGTQVESSDDVLNATFDAITDAGTVSTVYSTYLIAGTPDAAKIMYLNIRSRAGLR